MTKPKPIKVCLVNRGADSETPWAHDLGAAPGPKGSRRVRLVNVPFLHAKPTWGDIVVVSPGVDGVPTWDRDGAAWKDIGKRIAEDGGRWAMIVDYAPRDATAIAAFRALAAACEAEDIVCEAAWPPKPRRPGRAYLAVAAQLADRDVMAKLGAAKLPCALAQIHPPALAKPKPRPARSKRRAT